MGERISTSVFTFFFLVSVSFFPFLLLLLLFLVIYFSVMFLFVIFNFGICFSQKNLILYIFVVDIVYVIVYFFSELLSQHFVSFVLWAPPIGLVVHLLQLVVALLDRVF